jgi:lipopolysaccharide transport system permease protein
MTIASAAGPSAAATPYQPSVPAKGVLEVTGGPGRLSRESARELWAFREVWAAFVVRQIRVRYKQAVVGIGWAVIQPVLSAVVFTIFLGHVAHVSSDGSPYLLFSLAGTVAWSYFSMAASAGMESVVMDSQLLRKVYFPREVLPLAAITASLVDFVPGLVTLLVTSFAFGIAPAVQWLALPIPIVILVLSAAALSIGLSGVNVYYRDVRYALPFLLSIGLFASPVVWSLDAVPPPWRTIYAIVNPIAAAIDSLRRIVAHHQWPSLIVSVGALTWAFVLCVGGAILFKRLERGFADRV